MLFMRRHPSSIAGLIALFLCTLSLLPAGPAGANEGAHLVERDYVMAPPAPKAQTQAAADATQGSSRSI